MNRPPILLAVLLALSACSSDGATKITPPATTAAVSSTAATVQTVVPTTTSTTSLARSPSTSTSTSASAPATIVTTAEPVTTEPASTDPATTVAGPVDWVAVVQTLGQRRQDLYAAPDVSRIPDVCGDQSQCADQLDTQIGDLATKAWRIVGADPYVVLDANVEKFDGDTLEASLLVTVVAVVQRPAEAGRIVDSSGSLIADVQAQTTVGHNAHGRFLLARVGPADDPWRIVSQDTLPEVPA